MNPRGFLRLGRRAWLGGSIGLLAAGCVKKSALMARDFATRIRPAPAGLSLEPAPPARVYWMRVLSAKVPSRTANGRLWDEMGGWPDPKVVVEADGRKLLETPGVANTMKPTFEDGPSGNFEIDAEAKMTVTLFDADTLNDRPIGRKPFRAPTEVEAATGTMTIDVGKIGNPGSVTLAVEPAHPLIGLGFDYELFETKPVISKVLKHSPAARVGIEVGDVLVGARDVLFRDLDAKAIKSAINTITTEPVQLIVQHDGGTTENFSIAEGPVYALYDEWGDVP